MKVSGTPCRESVNPCDLPEYCMGNSGFCPEDFYAMDSLTCEDSSAYCYEGRCQTYDYQCKTIFEPGVCFFAAETQMFADLKYVLGRAQGQIFATFPQG